MASAVDGINTRQPMDTHCQPLRLRQNYPRSRSGCLTCRQRKKKCDEARPICAGCYRNKINCVWGHVLSLPGRGVAGPIEPNASLELSYSSRNCKKRDLPKRSSHSLQEKGLDPSSSAYNNRMSPSPLVLWSFGSGAFLGVEKAITLTPTSCVLMQHYLTNTCSRLATTPDLLSPFLTHLVPLACVDDLLMHTVLALSGTHLSFKQPGNFEVQRATELHYSVVLRSLRAAFQDVDSGNGEKISRLLLILLILCHFEAMAANMEGSIFPHLRACQQLVKIIFNEPHQRNGNHTSLLGLALELYAYLVLANSITPYDTIKDRTLTIDPLLMSLGTLSKYETFGTVFGGSHGLFEIIPEISLLFQKKLLEEKSRELRGECITSYEALRNRITGWQLSDLEPIYGDSPAERKEASEVYRHALFIYLETAISGSTVDPKSVYKIQGHIDSFEAHILQLGGASPFSTIMLWPIVIAASCMINEGQRKRAIKALSESRFQMKSLLKACDLLKLLWNDADKCAYGPYGLHLIMKKYGISYSMA